MVMVGFIAAVELPISELKESIELSTISHRHCQALKSIFPTCAGLWEKV
jgi:hypothetical protein